MLNYKNLLLIIVITGVFSCSQETEKTTQEDLSIQKTNPCAKDFDTINSDSKAIDIADKVMLAMGGRKAWDNTKVVKWNFFGTKTLIWDKQNGDVRIQFGDNDSNIFITNIFTHKGKIKMDGVLLTNPDAIKKYTKIAESIWINDAYWLFMPFKLKDSKTTLKYLDVDTIKGGIYSYKLQLTFNEIGDTPENKYWIWVDTTKMLVNQWAYFDNKTDTTPRFITPWKEYQQYGNILLSSNRGKVNLTDIEVLDSVPSLFF